MEGLNDGATITGLIQEEVRRLKEQKEFAATAEKEESAIIAEIEKVTKKIGTLQEQIEELQTKRVSLARQLLAIVSNTPNNTYSVLELIENLDLSNRTYNRLKESGFNTVGDILNYPFEDFYRVQHLPVRILKETVDKMREIGYPEFGTADFKNKETSIEYLDLHSYYDYEHLKEDGFNTIGDLLSCPFEYFYELEYSVATIRNLIRKMHKIGYSEFGTEK